MNVNADILLKKKLDQGDLNLFLRKDRSQGDRILFHYYQLQIVDAFHLKNARQDYQACLYSSKYRYSVIKKNEVVSKVDEARNTKNTKEPRRTRRADNK